MGDSALERRHQRSAGTHYLRAGASTKGVGFVLITGRAEQEIIDHGKKLGMNNYLKKPFQPQELRDCIEAVVGRL